ncbi:MAG: ribonuclease III [Myxococcota bacterium]
MTVEPDLARLEELLGHRFRDPALSITALSHPSYSYETDGSRGNERLEFLGDAVLGMWVAELLYEAHPEWEEGLLSRARAALVSGRALAQRARALDLGAFLLLGRTEVASGGRDKESILANAFEALAGAVYVDAGADAARELVERLFGEDIRNSRALQDPKTAFQEWAHAEHRTTPQYALLADNGIENHADRFCVKVRVGEETYGTGVGRTQRAAERAAAEDGLVRIRAT